MNFFGSNGTGKKGVERASAPAEPQAPPLAYGIQDAILLMRTLPVDQNVELVVSVIKRTLESLEVGIPDLIEDAARRQALLTHQVQELHRQIVDLEREIQIRKEQILQIEADYAETTMCKERLEIAESVSQALTTHYYGRPAI